MASVSADDTEQRDFFTDPGLSDEPYEWLEAMRDRSPVLQEPHHATVVVTGMEEVIDIYSRPGDFSNVNCVGGPFASTTFVAAGADIRDQIEAERDRFLFNQHFITFDGARHKAHRTLMTRLFTVSRLKSNEAFMLRFADQLIEHFAVAGRCEVIADYAQPLATMVIADLLGVPEAEREALVAKILPPPGSPDYTGNGNAPDPFADFEAAFSAYLEDRQEVPQEDMLTDLANACLPDGSDPGIPALVRVASFMFIAGQDTSAKLLASGLREIAERPDVQAALRADRGKIPAFLEEVLRYESPTKADFRLATRTTRIGGVEIAAGTSIMLSLAGANRDPRVFAAPDRFDMDREHVRDHVAFGRGVHACPGAPLARMEARVGIERMFDAFDTISIDCEHHGEAESRHYEYPQSYILRGLDRLYLRLD